MTGESPGPMAARKAHIKIVSAVLLQRLHEMPGANILVLLFSGCGELFTCEFVKLLQALLPLHLQKRRGLFFLEAHQKVLVSQLFLILLAMS